MDDESQGVEPSAEELPAEAAAPTPERPQLNPRQRRARRRRRRRQIGTLLFVLVAGAILATAYFAIAGDDDSSTPEVSPAAGPATTTTALPFSANYKVTTGLNVRQGPGTTFPTVGVVEQGRDVIVACVIDGEPVTAATGATSQWLKVTGAWPAGYVSAAYVLTGDDLLASKIPACPSA